LGGDSVHLVPSSPGLVCSIHIIDSSAGRFRGESAAVRRFQAGEALSAKEEPEVDDQSEDNDGCGSEEEAVFEGVIAGKIGPFLSFQFSEIGLAVLALGSPFHNGFLAEGAGGRDFGNTHGDTKDRSSPISNKKSGGRKAGWGGVGALSLISALRAE
jgi:hypothetical protein